MNDQFFCPKCGNPAVILKKQTLSLATGKPVTSGCMGVLAIFAGLALVLMGAYLSITTYANPRAAAAVASTGNSVCFSMVAAYALGGALLSYGWSAFSPRLRGKVATSLNIGCPTCKYKWSQLKPGENIYPGIEQDWRLHTIKTASGKVRTDAILELGKIGDEKALDPLYEILRDRSAGKVNDRIAAAEALGDLGYKQAVDPLVGVLNDHPLVVKKAVQALGKIGAVEAVGPLAQILRPGGEMPHETAKPTARDFLTKGIGGVEAEKELRWLAAVSLSKIKDPSAIEVLNKVVQDDDPAIRQIAQDAVNERVEAGGGQPVTT